MLVVCLNLLHGGTHSYGLCVSAGQTICFCNLASFCHAWCMGNEPEGGYGSSFGAVYSHQQLRNGQGCFPNGMCVLHLSAQEGILSQPELSVVRAAGGGLPAGHSAGYLWGCSFVHICMYYIAALVSLVRPERLVWYGSSAIFQTYHVLVSTVAACCQIYIGF